MKYFIFIDECIPPNGLIRKHNHLKRSLTLAAKITKIWQNLWGFFLAGNLDEGKMQEFMRKIPRISALTARECLENDAFSGRIFERIGTNITGFLKESCWIYGRILRDFFVEKIKKFISPISFFFYFPPPFILFYFSNTFLPS